MKYVPKELVETADVSRGKSSAGAWIKTLVSGAVSLLLLYVGLGLAADLLAASVSEETEAKVFGALVPDAGPASPELKRAQAVFAKLIANERLRPLPYSLHLMPEEDSPNAFAMPGGRVAVTPALLREVTSEGGLAFVLAHELGHHQHRHSLERMGRALLHQVALVLLFGDGGGAVERTVSLAESGHSRGQEREADAFGLTLVHETFGNTSGCLEFFESLRTQQGQPASGVVDPWARGLLSSHPLTDERIEALRALQTKLDEAR